MTFLVQHNPADLVGRKFGRLLVLQLAGKDKWGSALVACICDCDSLKTTRSGYVRTGKSQSCGCYKTPRHGHAVKGNETAEYIAYLNAKQRCTNPNLDKWENYGGGIEFRFDSFEQFYAELGDKPEPKHLYSVDRINNDGNYEVGNVRWATANQQQENKRPKRPRSGRVQPARKQSVESTASGPIVT